MTVLWNEEVKRRPITIEGQQGEATCQAVVEHLNLSTFDLPPKYEIIGYPESRDWGQLICSVQLIWTMN